MLDNQARSRPRALVQRLHFGSTPPESWLNVHQTAAPPPDIGRYQVTGELARGRQSRVLLARRRGAAPFTRTVAIKLDESGDRDGARGLRREALLAARLDHPGIARVEDLEAIGSRPFLVMELVRGVPLADLIAAAGELGIAMPAEVAFAIAGQLCEAIHHLHEARGDGGESIGLVHRAIAPDNVMIALGGWVKVLDFGAALTNLDRAPLLGPDDLTRFTAPEVWSDRETDRRADVYSLGVVLRELMSLCGGEVDDAATRLHARAAALDPSLRFASAAELGATLESFAWQHGISSAPRRVAAYLAELLRLAADAVHERSETSPLPGLERAMASRQPVSPHARTRIRLRRRGRPIALQ